MARYRYLCNETVSENCAFFSLHVLYEPRLLDLFLVKIVRIIFKFLRYLYLSTQQLIPLWVGTNFVGAYSIAVDRS